MYVKFKTAINDNLSLLEKLSNRDVLNQIAWLARNLLELLVWVKYCNSSTARAREFWDDSIRDLYSLLDPNDENDPEFVARLGKAIALIRTEKEPNAWKRVSKAASAVKQEGYDRNSQTLSKFVHPMAMSVVIGLPLRSRKSIQQRLPMKAERSPPKLSRDLKSPQWPSCTTSTKRRSRKHSIARKGRGLE